MRWPTRVGSLGTVAGTSLTTWDAQHAFVWTPTAGLSDLGTLDGDFADAHFNLAGLCEKLGREADALRHYRAYQQLTAGRD